jgi:hypothetical protein
LIDLDYQTRSTIVNAMQAKFLPLLLLSVCLGSVQLFSMEDLLLKDDYSSETSQGPRARRGEWKFVDHIASCMQTDELHNYFQNHGPIIFCDLGFTDREIRFQFKTGDARSFAFTGNGENVHVLRMIISAAGTTLQPILPTQTDRPL